MRNGSLRRRSTSLETSVSWRASASAWAVATRRTTATPCPPRGRARRAPTARRPPGGRARNPVGSPRARWYAAGRGMRPVLRPGPGWSALPGHLGSEPSRQSVRGARGRRATAPQGREHLDSGAASALDPAVEELAVCATVSRPPARDAHRGVRSPGPPPLRTLPDRPHVVGKPQRFEPASHPEVTGRERVGVAQRAHRDVGGGPLPDAADRLQCASVGASSALPERPRSPRAAASARARIASARVRGMPNASRGPRASRSGVGKSRTIVPDGVWSGSPNRSAMRPSVVRAPATDTCCPTIARTASSNPSVVPGRRGPARRTSGNGARSAASAASIASGSASRSSSRRADCTTPASRCTSSPTPLHAQRHGRFGDVGLELERRSASLQSCTHRPGVATAFHVLHARIARMPRKPNSGGCQRRTVREAQLGRLGTQS